MDDIFSELGGLATAGANAYKTISSPTAPATTAAPASTASAAGTGNSTNYLVIGAVAVLGLIGLIFAFTRK